jgi:hypothetical protein
MRQTLDALPGPRPDDPGRAAHGEQDLRALEQALSRTTSHLSEARTRGRASGAGRRLGRGAPGVGPGWVAAFAIAESRPTPAGSSELAAVRAEGAEASGRLTAAETANQELRTTIAGLEARIAKLQDAKVRTVTETETVTETVTEYVPNGRRVTVEVTGFDGLVEIYDVRLTHAYGYSDLIGIAENTSGETISYAQLGCSFLDAEGGLLATGMDNKQGWRPGQSWGFVCSADVNATGGILRVDEIDRALADACRAARRSPSCLSGGSVAGPSASAAILG